MLRIEFKKKNKNNNKSAKGAYEYITRSGLNRKEEIAKSTDLIFTSSKIPVIFEKENQFWNTIDKNERKNGRVAWRSCCRRTYFGRCVYRSK